jgi:hypothetical protein
VPARKVYAGDATMDWRNISEHERSHKECATQCARAAAMSADARLMGERAGKMIAVAFAARSDASNRRQHTVGDPPWALADSAHLGLAPARVHLDDLGPHTDRHTMTREAAKHSIERRA